MHACNFGVGTLIDAFSPGHCDVHGTFAIRGDHITQYGKGYVKATPIALLLGVDHSIQRQWRGSALTAGGGHLFNSYNHVWRCICR